jgi:type IV secretory pathway VirD2 relaxase
MGARARRVVLKSRFVVLARAGRNSVATHLRYIQRDGTTRDGGRGQAYGPDADSVDLNYFEERGRGDRHQFRMILSAEDADQLQDLKQFTRAFMTTLAKDLETRLDWIAVDHWDTDNPHTHIVLRGRTATGEDLVIAPSYMAHGMRMRGSDILTAWLGPRTELEMQESLRKEVTQERFTSLDRSLLTLADHGMIDLGGPVRARRDLHQLRGRLERLKAMGLAIRLDQEKWRMLGDVRGTLQTIGERGDIVRAVHLAMKNSTREIAFEQPERKPIVGRVAGKGIEELFDTPYLVVDAVDGRAHLVKMHANADLSKFPVDSIVEARPRPNRVATVRGICDASIEEQIRATSPTWLDRQLLARTAPAATGFGAEVRKAILKRAEVLLSRGVADLRGGGRSLRAVAPDFMQMTPQPAGGGAASVATELLAASTGPRPAKSITGEVILPVGRFAMVESERGFSLIPWDRAVKLGLARDWLPPRGPAR